MIQRVTLQTFKQKESAFRNSQLLAFLKFR